MAYYKTLAELQLAIRRRLGWPSADTFVSDAELAEMIRQSQRDLVNLLVQVHQGDYNVQSATIATAAGSTYVSTSAIAAGALAPVLRVLRVSVAIDGVSVPLKRLGWDPEARNESSQAWTRGTDIRYRWVKYAPTDNGILFLHPPPDADQVVTVVYIPGPGTLSLSTAINYVGHDEYIVLDCMVKCLDMEETDSSQIERRKAQYVAALEQTYTPVDIGQPSTIVDSRNTDTDIWGRR